MTTNLLNRNCSKANTTLFIFLSKHMNSIQIKKFLFELPKFNPGTFKGGSIL